MTQLDISWLAFAAGTLVPLLVGLITRLSAPSWLKAGLNAVLSVAAGGLAVAIEADGAVELSTWLANMGVAWVTAMATYLGWWKPSGISPALNRRTARIGVG